MTLAAGKRVAKGAANYIPLAASVTGLADEADLPLLRELWQRFAGGWDQRLAELEATSAPADPDALPFDQAPLFDASGNEVPAARIDPADVRKRR